MKNLINYLSKKSLSLGNGSGMTRQCFGITSTKSRNSLESILSRFYVASLICVLMLTLGVGSAWGATIASWGKISITANTDYTASGGDANNTSTAKFRSTKAINTGAGTYSYYGSGAGGSVITFRDLNLSTYSSIQMTFYSRASSSGSLVLAYSMDGSSWVNIGSASLNGTESKKTISGIPYYATYLRLTHTASSGSLYFGTVEITGTSATMRSVTWYVNGETTTAGSPTTSVPSGATVGKLPTSPASSACDGSKVFVGWTATPIEGTTNTEPSDLFGSYQEAPSVSANVSYYAVFATATPGSNTNTTYSFLNSSAMSTSISAGWSVSATPGSYDGTYGATWLRNNLALLPTFSFTPSVKISKITITVRQSNTTGSNTVTCSAAGVTIDTKSMSGTTQYDMEFSPSFSSKGAIAIICSNTSSNSTGQGSFYVKSITLTQDGTTYSEYVTSCSSCADPTEATSGTFNRSTQIMPINWTSAAGKVDVCYSTSSTTPAATPSASYTVVSNQTSSPVNLNVSNKDAGNYYCWVRSVCDAESKSGWVAITGSYFTIPSHTLTVTATPASSGTFTKSPNVTSVVEGRTVSITASPAAGYNFTSWAVSGTNATLSSTSTNPTTFTMGTANATVTGTFTAKPLNSITLSAASGTVYVGQYVQFTITYDPADILTKGTTLVSTPSYCVNTGTTNTTLKITGGRGGVTITEDVTETVSIKANADNTKTASVEITVKPLPKVQFVDIIHGYEFSDVAGTIEDNALVSNKTTPTHDAYSGVGANTCETEHTRLVGWVEKTWADEHPNATKETMEAADPGIYFTAGATINVLTYNGNTYYAVWAKLQ